MHFTFYDGIIAASFLMSLSVFLKRPVPIYLKLFPLYFLSAFLIGLRMEWLANHGHYNTSLANVWGIIEFCYFFFIVHENIVNKRVRRIILNIIVIFAFLAFVNIFFIQKKVGFNPVNFTVGCLIIVSLCIYYFAELFQKVASQSLLKLPSFWIVSGLIFNNVLSFPQYALSNFMETLTKTNYNTYHIIYDNIDKINYITIILTSILYSIGFLCRIRPIRSAH
jgi:hypothetical protein